MPSPKDPKSSSDASKPAETAREPTSVGEQGSSRRSGRVAYDSRGNTVWEWQLETGVYTRDVNTQRLKKLDLGELSLADTAINKKPVSSGKPAPQPGGGFNPYDSAPSSGGVGFNPYDNARSLGNRMTGKSPAPAAPARTPADLKKLDEWVKLKKKLQDTKED
jgi:hypothetical protein